MGVGSLAPRGVTLHYTAAGDVTIARNALLESGNGYHLIVARNGKVIQLTYLDLRVNHAGKAMWRGLSPNRNHLAVAVDSWGRLSHDDTGFHTFSGRRIDAKETASRPGNTSKLISHWHAATPSQEAALFAILKWLVALGIDPRNICGHDECALPAGRKSDPGGVLSKTVVEIRKSLMP